MACGGPIMGAAGLTYGLAGGVFDIAEAAKATSPFWVSAADAGVGAAFDIQSMLLGGAGLFIDGYNALRGSEGEPSGGSASAPTGPRVRGSWNGQDIVC